MNAVAHVFQVHELASFIIEAAYNEQPSDFLSLAKVNKSFKEHVQDIIPTNPPCGGLPYLLSKGNDYELSDTHEWRLREGLKRSSRYSWYQLHLSLIPRLHTLNLDLLSVRPQSLFAEIRHSCPSPFTLPNLHTLRLSMNFDHDHVAFVERFMHDTVKNLSVEMYWPETKPWHRGESRTVDGPKTGYETVVAEDQEELEFSHRRSHVEPSEMLWFDTIQDKLPYLETLRFYIEDAEATLKTHHRLVRMVKSLKWLTELELAAHTCTAPLIALLSPCKSLKRITVFRPGYVPNQAHIRDPHFATDACSGLLRLNTGSFALTPRDFCALTTLTLASYIPWLTSAIEAFDADVLPSVDTLDMVMLSEWTLPDSDADVKALLRAIAGHFDKLRKLKIGPVRLFDSKKWCVTESTLAALEACENLEELEIGADNYSSLDADAWGRILPNWPKLEKLLLENTNGKDPMGEGEVGDVDEVLNRFVRFCPRIQTLSICANLVVRAGKHVSMPCSLQLLEIVSPRSPGNYAHTVASYLDAVLPSDCALSAFSYAADEDDEEYDSDEDFCEDFNVRDERVAEVFVKLRNARRKERKYSKTWSPITRTEVYVPQSST